MKLPNKYQFTVGYRWYCGLVILLLVSGNLAAQVAPFCPAGNTDFTQPFKRFMPGDTGTPLLKRTLTGPNSYCNDGTRAVMYIRPANYAHNGYWRAGNGQPTIHVARWVIWLQGGGSCRDADTCLARWCGTDGKSSSISSNMSSNNSFYAIAEGGIFDRVPNNLFAGYNHVVIKYCSSDSWIGSNNLAGVPTSSSVNIDIKFQGAAIVRDAITTLTSMPVAADPHPLFGFVQLPPLQGAMQIVLAGSSAGGVGVRHHLDSLKQQLQQTSPNAVIAGVIDAGLPPVLWGPGINWANTPTPNYANHLVQTVLPMHAFRGTDNSALNQDCLNPLNAAQHVADGGVYPLNCYDATYTVLKHIATPFFISMDLNDFLPRSKYISRGFLNTPQDFISATQQQMLDLATMGTLQVPNPGVFAPKCNDHVRLTEGKFFRQRIRDQLGNPGHSFHDLLYSWLNGGPLPNAEIQSSVTASICP